MIGHRPCGNGYFVAHLLVTTACVAIAAHALAQQPSRACGCQISKALLAKYDKQLWLSKKDRTIVLKTHLPWGVPVDRSHENHERILVQRDYVIGYDDQLRVPVWTAHRLRAADLKQRSRIECFRNDQRLPDKVAAFCTDYDEPIFDRGHLVPNSDMTMSQQSMINTYIFSNMTPQRCAFNRGIWQVFEGLVRGWVLSKGTLYILTGSIFDTDEDGLRDEDSQVPRMRSKNKRERVAIPTHEYKILVHEDSGGVTDTIALMLPNVPDRVPAAETNSYLEQHIVSIEDIERMSGLSLFPNDPKKAISALKAFKATSLWPSVGKSPSPLNANCK